MHYAYCRISTPKQSMERQVRNILKLYPNATIFQEVYTGTKIDGRRKWEQLLRTVQAGDAIIFDSVSRMSRNAEEGFSAYQELYERDVDLVFLKEPHINTQTYKQALSNHVKLTGDKVDYILEGVNKYLMALAKEQIRLAFEQAEKEVSDLHQRTREGIETAALKRSIETNQNYEVETFLATQLKGMNDPQLNGCSLIIFHNLPSKVAPIPNPQSPIPNPQSP